MYPLNKETLELQHKTQALLSEYEHINRSHARRYQRQIKQLTAFWETQKTLNEGTFLDERYPLDYYFHSERLNGFVDTYYKALDMVLRNALQPEAFRCDEYRIILDREGEELVFTLVDSQNWRYLQQRYGCAHHQRSR